MKRIREFREFIGEEVWKLFWMASFVGFLLFLVESSFVLVLQGFLLAVNLVPADRLLLPDWYPKSVNGAMALLVLFGIGRGAVFIAKSYLSGTTTQAFLRTQRGRIMEYGLRHAGETSVPEMIALFTERVSLVGGAFFGISQLILYATSTVFLLGSGLYMAPIELILGIFFLGLFVLPLFLLNRRIKESSHGLVREWEAASRSLIQGLRHHFFFKIYCLIERELVRGKKSLEDYSQHFRSYYLTASIKNALPLIVGVIVVSIITIISQKYIGTAPAKLISFFYLFIRIAQGGSEINATLNDIRLQLPGMQQLMDFHRRTLTLKVPKNIPALTKEESDRFLRSIEQQGVTIEMRDLTFAYSSEEKLLENMSIKITRGDRLVIQGESGSGKSTLLSLALGVLEPQKGTVLINGVPIQSARNEVASFLGYVGPEPFLTEGTVRENILYGYAGSKKFSDTELWTALEKAQLADFIRQLPKKLEERLFELAQLSTGQKQRLAIARALLRQPKLLVLDEATANLDPATEKAFIESIEPLFIDTTVLIISHKDSFNRIATNLLRLGK